MAANEEEGVQQALHSISGPPSFVLVSDLDHTMVQNEDPTHERLSMFNRLWMINFAANSLLVFSTGRSPHLFCQLWDEAPLLTPNVLICSVGTEVFYRRRDGSFAPDLRWVAHLDQGWDRAAAAAAAASVEQLTPQAASEQRRHKLSYRLRRGATPADDAAALDALRAALAAAGVRAKVVYSGGVDVDVLAAGAGKGKALEFLLGELRELGLWPADGVQVNGDSGNDAELFDVPGVRGCVVGNAHAELRAYAEAAIAAGCGGHIHVAQQPCAGGIVEALMRFGTVPRAAAGGQQQQQQQQSSSESGGGSDCAGALLRATVAELGLLQSNALAGNLAPLSAPGATWVTPAGRLLRVAECQSEPADAAAAGLTWVDAVAARPLSHANNASSSGGDGGAAAAASTAASAAAAADGGGGAAAAPYGGGPPPPAAAAAAGELLLVTYQLWGFKGAARDSARVRLCSAVVAAPAPGGADGYRLHHLHESVMDEAATATAALRALAAAHGGDGGGCGDGGGGHAAAAAL